MISIDTAFPTLVVPTTPSFGNCVLTAVLCLQPRVALAHDQSMLKVCEFLHFLTTFQNSNVDVLKKSVKPLINKYSTNRRVKLLGEEKRRKSGSLVCPSSLS